MSIVYSICNSLPDVRPYYIDENNNVQDTLSHTPFFSEITPTSIIYSIEVDAESLKNEFEGYEDDLDLLLRGIQRNIKVLTDIDWVAIHDNDDDDNDYILHSLLYIEKVYSIVTKSKNLCVD